MAFVPPSLDQHQVTLRFKCSHAELLRLLRERRAPLPVRIEGAVRWYEDEVTAATAAVQTILSRRRRAA
jgi:predicted DNA-binding transcriptional regulator AlpA